MEHPDIRLIRGDQFIQIIVRHARTHIDQGKAQFTDYEVELKTNHIAFTLKYSKVRRRYSDFVWLRNRLLKDILTSDLPSLPGRRLFGRFNKDFIKQRQKKLQEFLFGLVQSNLFLSHAGVHLFLQSKLTTKEINEYLDSNWEEDPIDTILGEAERKARIEGIISRDYCLSKHDSGIDGDFDDTEWLLSTNKTDANVGDLFENVEVSVTNGKDDDANTDGHFADNESDGEKSAGEKSSEDEELKKDLTELRLSSLPEPPNSNTENDEFESSVEYLLSATDSEASRSCSRRNSARGSMTDVKENISSLEINDNVRGALTGEMNSLDINDSVKGALNSSLEANDTTRVALRKKSKRRYSRKLSSVRKSFANSIASLPELATTDDFHKNDDYNSRCRSLCEDRELAKAENDSLRRKRFSFNDFSRQLLSHNSLERNDYVNIPNKNRVRRSRSFMSSAETIKRISLSEYIIVERNSYCCGTKKQKEFSIDF